MALFFVVGIDAPRPPLGLCLCLSFSLLIPLSLSLAFSLRWWRTICSRRRSCRRPSVAICWLLAATGQRYGYRHLLLGFSDCVSPARARDMAGTDGSDEMELGTFDKREKASTAVPWRKSWHQNSDRERKSSAVSVLVAVSRVIGGVADRGASGVHTVRDVCLLTHKARSKRPPLRRDEQSPQDDETSPLCTSRTLCVRASPSTTCSCRVSLNTWCAAITSEPCLPHTLPPVFFSRACVGDHMLTVPFSRTGSACERRSNPSSTSDSPPYVGGLRLSSARSVYHFPAILSVFSRLRHDQASDSEVGGTGLQEPLPFLVSLWT